MKTTTKLSLSLLIWVVICLLSWMGGYPSELFLFLVVAWGHIIMWPGENRYKRGKGGTES